MLSFSTSFWERTGELLSMMLVGALWGCTNPLLRKGSVEATKSKEDDTSKLSSSLKSFFKTFLNVRVWLPYALNQSGSLVFYVLLRNANLSLAVPVCNAMALVFSFVTSFYLGERLEKPLQTMLGAALILIGVAICVASTNEDVAGEVAADLHTADATTTRNEEPEL